MAEPVPPSRALRRLAGLVLPVLVAVVGQSAAIAASLSGKVVGVSDGDTITVVDANRAQSRVRLAGIDAPERGQAFGQRSRQHLARLCFGREVLVEWNKRDRWGRLIGKVLVDGKDVGLLQVEAGLAWHYKDFQGEQTPADRALYAEAEERAREKGVGLWIDKAPIPPWTHRKSRRDAVRKKSVEIGAPPKSIQNGEPMLWSSSW